MADEQPHSLLLRGAEGWGRRRDGGPRLWALTLSLALHVGVLLLAGDWFMREPLEIEVPFVVSLVVPGPEIENAREEPARMTPERQPESPALTSAGESPEPGGTGDPEAPVLEETPPPPVPPEVIEPAPGDSVGGSGEQPRRLRRDVVGEATERLLAQLDTIVPLPLSLAPPVRRPAPEPARGRTIGATAGIEGPLGQRGVLYLENPPYPSRGREEGIEAQVRLRFWVSAAGGVVRIEALRKSGYPEFESLARGAVSRWRFEPLPPGDERTEWGEVRIRWGFPLVPTPAEGGS
ncbi:MAG: energy transducer TonB [Candidatus Eisenbacteria sp.]|nr:energy transducer TonB [Candidatus Eisenbacteria bacterium]